MTPKFAIPFMILGAVVILASQSLFVVDQREQALVLQLGQPVGTPRNPGLHFKIPFIQEVRRFDRRILPVDPPPEQVVISSSTAKKSPIKDEGMPPSNSDTKPEANLENISGEPIIVDTFARYKITNPLQFLKTLRSVEAANSRLESILEDATRTVMGQTNLRQLLSAERNTVMNNIKTRVNNKIKSDNLGIEIVDVRIVRADLTPELRTSTVRRMISELQERATETRAKGEEQAKQIRATAEKERTILLAKAERDAQVIRGEGDNTAINTYAEAFNKDKEFYGFLRSMEAYKTTLANPDTRLILSPDSDFFKYFDSKSRQ
ncbi:MAG: protease modulator HflC [Alphaproteobacteria bacterium]|nr:protease modulator HflC [Alphaproteobacteria bacterium]